LPFGFIQPKVGQAVGQFLGELKEYDQRNTIHSSYMRLKIRININNPLKQFWKVRANEGNYVQIQFKYEKLVIFCYLCGLLGHTDKGCPKLFDMEIDTGVRGWGDNLRPLIRQMGTAATNRYLQDPIPSRPHTASDFGTGTQSAQTYSAIAPHSSPTASNFDGRISAVQREISAIKSSILSAQKHAIVKSGRSLIGTSSSHISSLPPTAPALLGCSNTQHRPVVLGLMAEAQNQPNGEDILLIETADPNVDSVEVKKRKRAKAVNDNKSDQNVEQQAATMTVGVEGTNVIGTSLGQGLDVVMTTHDNPMYEETIVTAGPEVQACREL
jgi:hypothetical protein